MEVDSRTPRADLIILLTLNFQKEYAILIQIENLSTVFNRTFIYSAIKGEKQKGMGVPLNSCEGRDNVRNAVAFSNKKFKVLRSVKFSIQYKNRPRI